MLCQDVPQAVEDQVSGIQDQVLEISVLTNDLGLVDGPLVISVEILPTEGTIEIVEDLILCTPKVDHAGEDGFSYIITDQDGEHSKASVLILLTSGVE